MADVILLPVSGDGNDPAAHWTRTFADAAASYVADGGEAKYLPPIIAHFGGRALREIHPYDVRKMAEQLYLEEGEGGSGTHHP